MRISRSMVDMPGVVSLCNKLNCETAPLDNPEMFHIKCIKQGSFKMVLSAYFVQSPAHQANQWFQEAEGKELAACWQTWSSYLR